MNDEDKAIEAMIYLLLAVFGFVVVLIINGLGGY